MRERSDSLDNKSICHCICYQLPASECAARAPASQLLVTDQTSVNQLTVLGFVRVYRHSFTTVMPSRLNEPHWCALETQGRAGVWLSKNCIMSIKASKRSFSSKVTWSTATYVVCLPGGTARTHVLRLRAPSISNQIDRRGGYVNLYMSTDANLKHLAVRIR